MQTTQPFGDATSHSYNIQHPVIFLVKEVVRDLKVVLSLYPDHTLPQATAEVYMQSKPYGSGDVHSSFY